MTTPQRLQISENRRFLSYEDGAPFFYLADTAWELFHRLNREEADHYLRDRAAKGFTVIQAVVLAELDGLHTPNPYGDCPLHNDDPTRPNEAYFAHVDWIVERAGELGLWMGMLPTWGDKWNRKWGVGPEIFTPENARVYGEWLGRRYRDHAMIWIVGGDRPIENETHRAITAAMAQGLTQGDGGAHLKTFHPNGQRTSAEWFHDAPWLDFNMQQNGHGANTQVWNRIEREYHRAPTKPVLDGEPLYEDHPIGFNAAKNGYSDAYEIRKFAYWDVFSGAFGHTYGDHSIWQMHAPQHGEGVNGPISTWREALHAPGAAQMGHLRALIESRPFLTRIPDQTLILSQQSDAAHYIAATRDQNGGYALIYIPDGAAVTVDLGKIAGQCASASWFDPRSGKTEKIGEFPTSQAHQFTPPARQEARDWVLVLDDATRDFSLF